MSVGLAQARSFLKENILDRSTKSTPGVIKVVQHIVGPMEDGSVVKEVSDGTMYMKAVFTKQSQDAFYENYEDSFNSQPEWQNAQLLLNQFHVQHQPASHPANEERKTRFILLVERFGLLNVHTGFFNKNSPTDIMADTDIQTKAAQMEGLQTQSDSRHTVGGSPETGNNPETDSQCTLNALLDELGQSSPPADQPEDQPDNEPSSQHDDNPDPEPISDPKEIDGIGHQLQRALEAMRELSAVAFLVSDDQQDLLDAIPEWKDDYIASSEENLPQHLTFRSSSSGSNSTQDFIAQGSTLRTERNRYPPRVSTDINSKLTAVPESDQKAAAASAGRKPQSLEEEGRGTSAVGTHEGREAEVTQGEDSVRQERIGLQSTPGPHEELSRQLPEEASESSEDAVSLFHHPDVSFTISSPSMRDDSSSGSQRSQRNGSDSARQSDASDGTAVDSKRDLPLPAAAIEMSPTSGHENCGQATKLASGDGLSSCGTASGLGDSSADRDPVGMSGETAANMAQQLTEPSAQAQSEEHAGLPEEGGLTAVTSDKVDQQLSTEGRMDISHQQLSTEGQDISHQQLSTEGQDISHQQLSTEGQDISHQQLSTDSLREEKSPGFELPQTLEFDIQYSLGFDPPADGRAWEQTQPDKHVTDWMQSQGFEPCMQEERAWEHSQTQDEADRHSTDSQGFVPSDTAHLGLPPDQSACGAYGTAGEDGYEQPQVSSAGRKCLERSERTGQQKQTSATLETFYAGTGRRREEDPIQEPEAQSKGRHRDGRDTGADALSIHRRGGNSSAAYQSTQSNSQPPSLRLTLSPIVRYHPARLSVLETDEEENSRLLALSRDIAGPASQAAESLDVPETPDASCEEGRDFDAVTNLTAATPSDRPSQESSEAEDGGRVLVQASWSDSGEDNLDRMLLQQAVREDRSSTTHGDSELASNQTTVVPESSPEDVIVISSANNSKSSSGTSQSSSSSSATSDLNGPSSHRQLPLSESVIVISSTSDSTSEDNSEVSGGSALLKGQRWCKLYPQRKNVTPASVNSSACRQQPLSKSSTKSVDPETSPGRSGQKGSDQPARTARSNERSSRHALPAVSPTEEESASNPAGQEHCHPPDRPSLVSGKEGESSGKGQQEQGASHEGAELRSPARRQLASRNSEIDKELRVVCEKLGEQRTSSRCSSLRGSTEKHHKTGTSCDDNTEQSGSAKKQRVQRRSRRDTDLRDPGDNRAVQGCSRELRDTDESSPVQKRSRGQNRAVQGCSRELGDTDESGPVQKHSRGQNRAVQGCSRELGDTDESGPVQKHSRGQNRAVQGCSRELGDTDESSPVPKHSRGQNRAVQGCSRELGDTDESSPVPKHSRGQNRAVQGCSRELGDTDESSPVPKRSRGQNRAVQGCSRELGDTDESSPVPKHSRGQNRAVQGCSRELGDTDESSPVPKHSRGQNRAVQGCSRELGDTDESSPVPKHSRGQNRAVQGCSRELGDTDESSPVPKRSRGQNRAVQGCSRELGDTDESSPVQKRSRGQNRAVQGCSRELGDTDESSPVQKRSRGQNRAVQGCSRELGDTDESGPVQKHSRGQNRAVQGCSRELGDTDESGPVQKRSRGQNRAVQGCSRELGDTDESGPVQKHSRGQNRAVQGCSRELGDTDESGPVQKRSRGQNRAVQGCSRELRDTDKSGPVQKRTTKGKNSRNGEREVGRDTVRRRGSEADSESEDFQEGMAGVKPWMGLIAPRDLREKRLRRLKLKEELWSKVEQAIAAQTGKIQKNSLKKRLG